MSTQPPAQPPATSAPPEEPLSVSQAAQLVGVSEQALRKRIRKGTLGASKERRGNQIVTVLTRAELEAAYPEVHGEPAPPPAASGFRPQPVAQPRGSDEAVVRLREDLATALAARRAAESRCEAAEERARAAENKLERALVQRGDELARTRKEAERQAMQMAMEIARAQIQARLPASTDEIASGRPRRLHGLALGSAVVAGVLGLWGWRAWSELEQVRTGGQILAGQVADLQGRSADAFERAAEAEAARLAAREEVHSTQALLADERARWEARQAELLTELAAARDAGEADRARLARRIAVERALRQLRHSERFLERLWIR